MGMSSCIYIYIDVGFDIYVCRQGDKCINTCRLVDIMRLEEEEEKTVPPRMDDRLC